MLVVALDDPSSAIDPVLDAVTEPGDGFTLRSAAIVSRAADGAVTIGEHAGDLDTAGTLVERHPRLAGLHRLCSHPSTRSCWATPSWRSPAPWPSRHPTSAC